jgi:ZIP family zinc transporter
MNPLLLTSMAAASTSVGGCCAVLLQRRIYLLMAFGSGVLVGAAAFDLLPASASAAAASGHAAWLIFLIAALGGIFVFSVAKLAATYSARASDSRAAGRISASLLVLHSVTDGTAIFAASTISIKLGLLVGLGVVAHDICDGLNTILLASGGRKAQLSDYVFLALDALAPIAGGLIAAHWFRISPLFVMVVLSFAAGSFLFAAAFELFPGAWRRGPRNLLPWIGLAGFVLMFGLTRILGALG